jgi:hypothetical protein
MFTTEFKIMEYTENYVTWSHGFINWWRSTVGFLSRWLKYTDNSHKSFRSDDLVTHVPFAVRSILPVSQGKKNAPPGDWESINKCNHPKLQQVTPRPFWFSVFIEYALYTCRTRCSNSNAVSRYCYSLDSYVALRKLFIQTKRVNEDKRRQMKTNEFHY